MEKMICKICKKEIMGYSELHVDYLMEQHKLKHKFEDKRLNKK